MLKKLPFLIILLITNIWLQPPPYITPENQELYPNNYPTSIGRSQTNFLNFDAVGVFINDMYTLIPRLARQLSSSVLFEIPVSNGRYSRGTGVILNSLDMNYPVAYIYILTVAHLFFDDDPNLSFFHSDIDVSGNGYIFNANNTINRVRMYFNFQSSRRHNNTHITEVANISNTGYATMYQGPMNILTYNRNYMQYNYNGMDYMLLRIHIQQNYYANQITLQGNINNTNYIYHFNGGQNNQNRGYSLNNLNIEPDVNINIGGNINSSPRNISSYNKIYEGIIAKKVFRLYPNPSKKEELIHIESKNTIQEIKLFSTQGTLLQTYKTQEYYHILNLNSFPRGTYLLHVITLNNIEKIKIILE
jgi:hypothetical protein